MNNNASFMKDSHAALSVGVSAAERMGWARFRQGRSEGRFAQTIAQRVRAGANDMVYNPLKGGWTNNASSSRWAGPERAGPTGSVNRNVRQGFSDVVGQARAQIRAQQDQIQVQVRRR